MTAIVRERMQITFGVAAGYIESAKIHIPVGEGAQPELTGYQADIDAGLMLQDELPVDMFNVKPGCTHHLLESHLVKSETAPALENGGGNAAGPGRAHGQGGAVFMPGQCGGHIRYQAAAVGVRKNPAGFSSGSPRLLLVGMPVPGMEIPEP